MWEGFLFLQISKEDKYNMVIFCDCLCYEDMVTYSTEFITTSESSWIFKKVDIFYLF